MIERRHGLAPVVAALVGIAACLQPPTESPISQFPRQVLGYWVVHVDGGLLQNDIELFRVDTTGGGLRLAELPTRDWTGRPRSGLGIASSSGAATGNSVQWTLELADGSQARMSWAWNADTLVGALSFRSDSTDYPLVGVPVSPLIVPTATRVAPAKETGDVPLVLIRLDDLPGQDRQFIPRLLQRGLYGEIAIPTAWVGTASHPSWSEVAGWTRQGFAAVAHSRYHAWQQGSPQIFPSDIL